MPRKAIRLGRISDEDLLRLRLRDLPVRVEGTFVQRQIKQLYHELENRKIRFKPHIWISGEFYTPDGVPGFAIPFYLTHPRLMRLERKQMFEVEGGTDYELIQILRHETGHALDNAYQIHLKKSWREVFGSFKQRYPVSYKPKPNSRKYVLHLDSWYAQAHPAEDWAETFAVWLRPGRRWRSRYKGWPALRKLEYVDKLMHQLGKQPRINRSRLHDEPLSELSMTLENYYKMKRQRYSLEYPSFYDRDLRRIFSDDPRFRSRASAATFLRRFRGEIRKIVSRGTDVHSYTIDHVLDNIIERAKELKLRLQSSVKFTKQETIIMLTVHTMNIVHSGRYRFHYGM
ncbi:putative zinc-binding metallopeptidase [bacterium]|nr:putative zinc-binding metallopeptidase [bacterium]MCI0606265.1 putative zinc-binding metallopeptidase [bacterium]